MSTGTAATRATRPHRTKVPGPIVGSGGAAAPEATRPHGKMVGVPIVAWGAASVGGDQPGSADPPLLLIQGLGYTADMWHRTAPGLAAEHRVVMFDNRGVGRSSVPD